MKHLTAYLLLCVTFVRYGELSSVCPPDKPLVNCFVDPCQFATCPAFPEATCVPNFCGGCNTDWFVGGKLVDCNDPSPCPPGIEEVACIVDPCSVSSCPRHPKAECRSNFCGGCFAVWFKNNKPVCCSPRH